LPTISRCWCSTAAAVRPGVEKLQRDNLRRRFATAADYQDPWLQQQLAITAGRCGRRCASARRPLISPPRALPFAALGQNWLGTDANGGDVLARILYGTRISVLFGLLLTLLLQRAGGAGRRDQGITAGKSTSGASGLSKSGPACRRCF
jgi:ABC-type microcin C transport system permease subunit YejE